jgi:hypothetical protein
VKAAKQKGKVGASEMNICLTMNRKFDQKYRKRMKAAINLAPLNQKEIKNSILAQIKPYSINEKKPYPAIDELQGS